MIIWSAMLVVVAAIALAGPVHAAPVLWLDANDIDGDGNGTNDPAN